MGEALYRKYRPSTFADVTDQEHVKVTIQNQIVANNVAHAYVFTGPRGVGKTTIARLIAKAVNCLKRKKAEPCNACDACKAITEGSALDVLEVDAASQTQVENVRENIIQSVRFPPNALKFKVYIIDEVHMLSTASFNALLKTLEEPPSYAIFILATTEIHKVPQTIVSRCQRFDFKRVPTEALVARLTTLVKSEGVAVSDDVLREVARHAEGCVRDAESLLGQILALGDKKITMAEASLVLPATTTVMVADFVESLLKRDASGSIRLLNTYVEQGADMPHFVDDTIDFIRTLLFAKLGGLEASLEAYDAKTIERINVLIASATAETLTAAIHAFLDARRSMKTDKIPQLGAELAVLTICGGQNFNSERVASAVAAPPRAVQPAVAAIVPIPKAIEPVVPPVVTMTQAVEPAIAAATTVFETVPVISLDEVRRKWPAVFQQIKECNASLPLVIQAGEVASVDGDSVGLTFQYALHADTVNQDKNRRLLENVLEKVLGKRVRIRATYIHAETEETVASVIEEFGGTVV